MQMKFVICSHRSVLKNNQRPKFWKSSSIIHMSWVDYFFNLYFTIHFINEIIIVIVVIFILNNSNSSFSFQFWDSFSLLNKGEILPTHAVWLFVQNALSSVSGTSLDVGYSMENEFFQPYIFHIPVYMVGKTNKQTNWNTLKSITQWLQWKKSEGFKG